MTFAQNPQRPPGPCGGGPTCGQAPLWRRPDPWTSALWRRPGPWTGTPVEEARPVDLCPVDCSTGRSPGMHSLCAGTATVAFTSCIEISPGSPVEGVSSQRWPCWLKQWQEAEGTPGGEPRAEPRQPPSRRNSL